MTGLVHICIVCGNPSKDGRKTCSSSCASTFRNAIRYKATRIHFCKTCKKPFKHRSRRGHNSGRYRSCDADTNTFCSRKCAGLSKRKPTSPKEPYSHTCAICGRVFIVEKKGKRLYCSHKCSVKAWNIHDDKMDRSERKCLDCGKLFVPKYGERRYSYCSKRCGDRAWKRNARHKRRAKKSVVTQETIRPILVYERDKWICSICEMNVDKQLLGTRHPMAPSIDNVIPISKGGPHTYDNVRLAHIACNGRKSDRILDPTG